MGLLMPVADPDLADAWWVQPWNWMQRGSNHNAKHGAISVASRKSRNATKRVVVSPEPLDHLKKFCRVLQPTEQESWKDYTVFKTVSWLGPGAPMEAPDGWLVLGSSPEEALILPERTIDWFTHNRRTLDVLCGVIDAMHADRLPVNAALEGASQRPRAAFEPPGNDVHARRCVVHR